MPPHLLAVLPKDNAMQIHKTPLKLVMEEDKQHQRTNNICLYYGELGHVACECLKKHGQHTCHLYYQPPIRRVKK
jgi:hypothetical protein